MSVFLASELVAMIINILTGIGISLSVIYIMIAGIQYITSMGKEEKIKRARNSLVSAITGLIVVISSVTIVYVVGNMLGANFSEGYLDFIIPF